MKAKISYIGTLTIFAENDTELYALKNWVNNSVDYCDTLDLINVKIGSFNITDNYIDVDECGSSGISVIDNVMETER